MLVYNPSQSLLNHSLRDFGLDIPLENSRCQRVICELQATVAGSWHYSGQWREVAKSDLYLAHHRDYVDKLFSHPEPWVLRAYEGEKYFTLPPSAALLRFYWASDGPCLPDPDHVLLGS